MPSKKPLNGITQDASIESVRAIAIAAARRLSSQWKRERRYLGIADAAGWAMVPSNAETHQRFREALWQYEHMALAKLPRLQRMALELYEMDGFSDRDIADASGCSARAARELRRTARASLRQMLLDGDIPCPPITSRIKDPDDAPNARRTPSSWTRCETS